VAKVMDRPAARLRNTLGLAAATSLVVGPALAALRLVPAIVGFVLFAVGGIVGLLVGVASLVQVARGRRLTPGGLAGLVAGVVLVVLAARGAGVPRINDFTTDPNDPPAFRHAATLPPNAGRDLAYPPSFAAQQHACCADLRPARLAVPVEEAFARARRTAESMPSWTVTAADPASGMLEAISTSRLFGFQDDIAIRVRADGAGASRVDVRSKSRDGQGDFGVNAARIRAYVAALENGRP
jgi:uncharacterized protein (DUF1499 family)